ncbi:hypothetical protein BT69DRAFT_1306730 [Atractiella rhizophila]|nr:hypothetical protein BT69DRAFT_1306730 [Atractiella rhizophila]
MYGYILRRVTYGACLSGASFSRCNMMQGFHIVPNILRPARCMSKVSTTGKYGELLVESVAVCASDEWTRTISEKKEGNKMYCNNMVHSGTRSVTEMEREEGSRDVPPPLTLLLLLPGFASALLDTPTFPTFLHRRVYEVIESILVKAQIFEARSEVKAF